jgi:hypothetical protein
MDKLSTIYIHTDHDGKKDAAKPIVNLIVHSRLGSLVAWYPDLGDDGLQALFVCDAKAIDIERTCNEIVSSLKHYGIVAQTTIQAVG